MDGYMNFDPVAYWRARYAAGGHSGTGSVGRLAVLKASFINGFVKANAIASVIDFGCGDGRQTAGLDVPAYCGVDVSNVALAHCRARLGDDPRRHFLAYDALPASASAQLGLSLDVICHLTETSLYEAYLARLFGCAERYVVLYTSNFASETSDLHVRHRHVTDDLRKLQPAWNLIAHVPNPFAYDPRAPDETSFADFFVYARGRPATIIPVPEAEKPRDSFQLPATYQHFAP
jgi:SAM-dependent methyltransferase